ncbi:acyl-CoA carboxylase subunit epsilon [Streptomyces sp. TRM70350]|uniref:acyl-CoA carboxylase subunit epsilon n=1 Tax=Streptomyces sp. TRM70350 TaxID=2856165 RepID=UPI001C474136|nr:acyl-CoA carboxylase subunit epsilon [Streptomyces sp. TRM70350]MBV7698876.1 acyl-CoA carboxylase subunit epsilon [Streptomyces sp. TRM70350]
MSALTLRVEKGHAEPEEVAAVTAILLASATARPASTPLVPGRGKARWRRWERQHGFPAPHSWRH